MKKIGLLLLVVAMVGFGMAGCGDKDEDPVGTWNLLLDSDCNNVIDEATVAHIRSDNTVIFDAGLSGTYEIDEDDITMNIAAGYLVFIGTVDGGSMSGNFVGIATGCWSAIRTSTTP